MSVYIKDMEYPANCEKCFFSKPTLFEERPLFCQLLNRESFPGGRLTACPLVDVTGMHLIDREKLVYSMLEKSFYPIATRRCIEAAPVIGSK